MTFKEAIKNYLDKFAIEDEPFAVAYKDKAKSIDKCCSYIISEVNKMKKAMKKYLTELKLKGAKKK